MKKITKKINATIVRIIAFKKKIFIFIKNNFYIIWRLLKKLIKEKSKQRSIMIVGTIALFILILIPYFIKKTILHNNSSTSSSINDGAWLSFWGSYLGGIFGGIATLIGITYTIKGFTDDKKPIIIPLKKQFYVYIDSESKNVKLLSNETNQEEKIHINIYNVGRENALNVNLKWIPPINIYINGELDNENMIVVPSPLDITMMSRKSDHFQVIMCTKSDENNEKIDLYVSLQFLIKEIYKRLLKDKTSIMGIPSLSKTSIGIIEVNFDDIYGHSETHKYKINIDSSLFFKFDENNSVFISFDKIN